VSSRTLNAERVRPDDVGHGRDGIHHHQQIQVADAAHGAARADDFEIDQFLRILLDDADELVQQRRTIRGRHVAPGRVVEGALRRRDCPVDVLCGAAGDFPDHLAGRRVVHFHVLAAARHHHGAIDKVIDPGNCHGFFLVVFALSAAAAAMSRPCASRHWGD